MKTFCIYCSDGASRVIKFFSNEKNLFKYMPKKVIYDGSREDVIEILYKMFGENLLLFNEKVEGFDIDKINISTSQFIHKIMDSFEIEYLLCFGNKILKKEFIDYYQNKLINFHPSILPSFKGLLAINQALDKKVSFLGNTAHYIDYGVDTGNVIIQTAMLYEEFEEFEDVLEMQFPMIKLVLRDILKYNVERDEIMEEVKNRKKQMLIPCQCNI